MFTRQFGKILRGKATPFQLVAACVLGALLGFAPGPTQAPALYVLLVAALLCAVQERHLLVGMADHVGSEFGAAGNTGIDVDTVDWSAHTPAPLSWGAGAAARLPHRRAGGGAVDPGARPRAQHRARAHRRPGRGVPHAAHGRRRGRPHRRGGEAVARPRPAESLASRSGFRAPVTLGPYPAEVAAMADLVRSMEALPWPVAFESEVHYYSAYNDALYEQSGSAPPDVLGRRPYRTTIPSAMTRSSGRRPQTRPTSTGWTRSANSWGSRATGATSLTAGAGRTRGAVWYVWVPMIVETELGPGPGAAAPGPGRGAAGGAPRGPRV